MDALSWTYCIVLTLCATILGAISLGVSGFLIGLIGGLLMSVALQKALSWAKRSQKKRK